MTALSKQEQDALYDSKPVRAKSKKAGKLTIKGDKTKLKRLAKHLQKEHPSTKGKMRVNDPAPSQPPKKWYEAMVLGIKRSSDVRNPYAIVSNIWRSLSASKRAELQSRAKKGEAFKYDLPLPQDKATKGTGTLRMVKPFNLAEVQVNLSVKDYLSALKSGLFSKMKRQDGSTALVARCKSKEKNCNLFIDKIGR